MVITDKFVYIHKPKTGGTFVTDSLLELHDGKWNWWIHFKLALLKKVQFKNNVGTLTLTANKHGGCLEIPAKHRDKIIVSTIRNPFDYYVSQYEFGWWKRKEWLPYYQKLENFKARYSTFPDLKFGDFLALMSEGFNPEPHKDFNDASALGRYTVEFIQSHFRNPSQVFQQLDRDYVQTGQYKRDMFDVQFIFTHQLNKQLYQFLASQGYAEANLQFILPKAKVLPSGKGRSADQKWQKYYSRELIDLVRQKDWFLFELFPEFDDLAKS